MVATLMIHVITWITTHLPTPKNGRLSWPSWLTHSGRLTHEVCEGNGFPLHTIFLRDHTHFAVCLNLRSPD